MTSRASTWADEGRGSQSPNAEEIALGIFADKMETCAYGASIEDSVVITVRCSLMYFFFVYSPLNILSNLSSFTTQTHRDILLLVFLSADLHQKHSFAAFQLNSATLIYFSLRLTITMLWDTLFLKKSGCKVLILQAPCFTNEPKLFWQHHTGSSLSRLLVSRMQLPAVFFVDQTKRKQQAKVSTDRLFSYSRQINLHVPGRKTKTPSVTNEIARMIIFHLLLEKGFHISSYLFHFYLCVDHLWICVWR